MGQSCRISPTSAGVGNRVVVADAGDEHWALGLGKGGDSKSRKGGEEEENEGGVCHCVV